MWIRAVIQTSEQKYFRNVSKTYLKLKITEYTKLISPKLELAQWKLINHNIQPLKQFVFQCGEIIIVSYATLYL